MIKNTHAAIAFSVLALIMTVLGVLAKLDSSIQGQDAAWAMFVGAILGFFLAALAIIPVLAVKLGIIKAPQN